MFVRQSLSLPNIQLSYLEWNRGKEPLLLLHGLADNALVWSSLGDYLVENYHIIAPDLRGHGDSTKPENDYTFTSTIADLEALMDNLGWSNTHVIGHSWSGKLACIWATRNPQRLKSMVLVDPIFIWEMPDFFKFSFPILYRVLPFLKGMGPFDSYEAAEQQARQLNQYKDWTPLQQKVFQNSIEQKDNGTWGSKFTIAARDGIFDEVMRIPGLIETVNLPTLFVQPEKGVNRQNWQLKPYKTYLKNLEISKLPGNHWCFMTEPEAFNQKIAEYLTANSEQLTVNNYY